VASLRKFAVPACLGILTRDAQDPTNHRHWQRVGEALDEIDLALALQLIEEGGDDAQYLGTQLLQVRRAFGRTKVAHGDPTQTVVLRWVQVDKLMRIWAACGPLVIDRSSLSSWSCSWVRI
jgi:hypothetical protein